jgi:predicted ArsR family transcriptional regulator
MSAVPVNVVPFELPKKPRVKQKDAPPDQRKLAVIPIRAGTDERLHGATLRLLIVLCSYCNRAGLTWVSQLKLAEVMKVSRQAVTKQMSLLRKYGYVEITRQGFKGERPNTLRVIFDQSINAEDAIAVTSSIEDTRPPVIKQEEEKQMDEQIDREGQKRIAQMINQALKQPGKPKEKTMPSTGETLAVKQIKEGMKKAQAKRSHRQPVEVANGTVQEVANGAVNKQSHRQPLEVASVATSEGSAEHTKNGTKESIKESKVKEDINNKNSYGVLSNLEVAELKSHGLTDAQIADSLDVLLPAYKAEGLTPTSRLLADSILQLHRDVR